MTRDISRPDLPAHQTAPLADEQTIDRGATSDDGYVLIVHEVADYHKWKAVFDAAQAIRRDAGEIDYQLLCSHGNDRQIVHFSRWRSLASARLFFESEELVRIRRLAGVTAPEFLYLHLIERGTLWPGAAEPAQGQSVDPQPDQRATS